MREKNDRERKQRDEMIREDRSIVLVPVLALKFFYEVITLPAVTVLMYS